MNTTVNKVLQVAGSDMLRAIPEPQISDAYGGFTDLLSTAGDVLSTAALGPYGVMMEEQMKVQQELLQVTMVSNIKRSQHETEMTPARNLKVG